MVYIAFAATSQFKGVPALVTSGLHFLICLVTLFSNLSHSEYVVCLLFPGLGLGGVEWAGLGSGMGACFLPSPTQLFDVGSVV